MMPAQRLSVPVMLDALEKAYATLIEREQPASDDVIRLRTVIDDMRWYAGRLGPARWEVEPRSDRWSFAGNLWHITEQAIFASTEVQPLTVRYFIDHGKEHVGQAAEIFAVFEYNG